MLNVLKGLVSEVAALRDDGIRRLGLVKEPQSSDASFKGHCGTLSSILFAS